MAQGWELYLWAEALKYITQKLEQYVIIVCFSKWMEHAAKIADLFL